MYIGVAGRFLWMTPNDSHPLCNILFLECVWNLWIRWPVTPVIMLHYMSRGTSSERASSNHASPLKAEFYSSKVKERVAEEEVRDSRHRGVLRCRCWLQRWRGPHARERRGSLEIVSSPQLAASTRKWRPRPSNCKEQNSANNLNAFGSEFFSWAPR